MSSSSTKLVAKNTLFLYIRMIVLMGVTLFTSRIVLRALGVEDYGIYNVVAGVVSMLGVLNSTMSGANSRFMAFAIGNNNENQLKEVVANVKCIHYAIALIVIAIAETVGLWFVLNKLVIPEDRMIAAIWCYQASVVTLAITIISVPYNSLIIAHERMKAFAYISLLDAFLRLLVAYIIVLVDGDHLIWYSILMMSIQVAVRCVYTKYCNKFFLESRVSPKLTKQSAKEIFSFVSYSFIGNLSSMFYNQGLSVVLNIFFGPVVNAARSIAQQVQGGCSSLVVNFQMAIQPQITKSWAKNNLHYLHTLITYSSKFSYYLTAIMVVPILMCVKPLLRLWLEIVPDYTVAFVRIILLSALIESLSHEMCAASHATGDVAKYHIMEGILLILIVPLSYVSLRFYNVAPEYVFYIYFCIQFITQIVRVGIALPQIKMPIIDYVKGVIFPVVLCSVFYSVPVYFVNLDEGSGWLVVLCTLAVGLLYVAFTSFIFGMSNHEKKIIVDKSKHLIKHIWNH